MMQSSRYESEVSGVAESRLGVSESLDSGGIGMMKSS